MSAIEKKIKEPSRMGVYLIGLIVAFFGMLLGIWYMMSFPLQDFSSLAERELALEDRESAAPIPGDAFYIKGETLRSRSWEAKRTQFLAGGSGSLEISEGEINAWLAAHFRGTPPSSAEDAEGFVVTPGTPNIAVTEEGVFYVNLPAQLSGYSIDSEYMLSATGTFDAGAPAKLRITNLQLGGAAIPLPSLLGPQVSSALMKGFAQSEEFQALAEVWERVDSVEILPDGLRLKLL